MNSTSNETHTAKSIAVTVRVWDLPLRLFHWGLVVSVVGAFITIKLGGLWMDWHVRFGLTTLALITFRVIWGMVGTHYARFSQFIRHPSAVWRYIRGPRPQWLGHNPLGSLSVIALLLMFGFQAVSGLFADDDIFTTGPLAYLSSSWSSTLTGLHKLNEWPMIGLVSLHVLAIIWYRVVYKEKLASAMVHGDITTLTSTPDTLISANDSWTVRISAVILAAAVSMATWWLTTLAPSGAGMSFM